MILYVGSPHDPGYGESILHVYAKAKVVFRKARVIQGEAKLGQKVIA